MNSKARTWEPIQSDSCCVQVAQAKGVVGGAEYGNEELRMTDFPRQPVNDRHGLPGIIDEQLLAGRVRLPHGDRQLADPLSVAFAEPAVLVALGMRRFIFLPQQLQRDALLAHFAVRPDPVRLGSDNIRRYNRREQPQFEGRIIHTIW